jgi:hypothetical protein
MRNSVKFMILPLSALAVFGASSINASARIVCNEGGACWHVHEDYAFPPTAGVIIHPDDWRWKEGERYTWREPPHPGRGYWKGEEWAPF